MPRADGDFDIDVDLTTKKKMKETIKDAKLRSPYPLSAKSDGKDTTSRWST